MEVRLEDGEGSGGNVFRSGQEIRGEVVVRATLENEGVSGKTTIRISCSVRHTYI